MMMTNLFSTFDPSSSLASMAWLSMTLPLAIFSTSLWKLSSMNKNSMTKILSTFEKEVSYSLSNTKKGEKLTIITMMGIILPINFLALYPQIFSSSAHLVMTLPLSLTMWMTIMLYGWTKNTKHMLSHMLPQGTPTLLMNFMVVIELTSNMIRPVTLCVRLTANMIAGHLLMSLMGSAVISLSLTSSMVALLGPTILTILESAVAIIQSYVFMTLITLYTTEIK